MDKQINFDFTNIRAGHIINP